MSREHAWAGWLSMGLLFAATSAPAQEPQLDIQYVVMRTPTVSGRFEAKRVAAEGGVILLSGPFRVTWGDASLDSDGRVLSVNGQTLSLGGDTAPPDGGGLSVVAAPRLRTLLGQRCQLKSGIGEPLQYFEREPDGRFALKPASVRPLLEVNMLPSKGSRADTVDTELKYRFVRLGKRTPLRGVSLDVGAPEVLESSGGTQAEVAVGEWHLLVLGHSDLTSGLVLLIKLTRH